MKLKMIFNFIDIFDLLGNYYVIFRNILYHTINNSEIFKFLFIKHESITLNNNSNIFDTFKKKNI